LRQRCWLPDMELSSRLSDCLAKAMPAWP